ncbi:MAG: hypothetical protein DWQ18_01715 [Crenarchaeota archaeon]|nr:MAG: hypothetical protein DWQ17_06815 [Thermoproteota archaeon]RDJ33672.1 MAG: hypothetical protein DWQ18_01715 [Thermoproteota archaeon]RDJ37250.1 MAG: hypothetical protein DWQ19_01925 [Thermoproteota archaeon]
MKTRYKILAVIASFVAFYFSLIPGYEMCRDAGSDCSVFQFLINLTRPVIWSGYLGIEGISEWSGTAQGITQEPDISMLLQDNVSFLLSMIVLPAGIISAIVAWDKR